MGDQFNSGVLAMRYGVERLLSVCDLHADCAGCRRLIDDAYHEALRCTDGDDRIIRAVSAWGAMAAAVAKPAHIPTPTDLDDHLFLDAEPTGSIVRR